MATYASEASHSSFEPRPHRIGLHDRVAVPDGRVGNVIGFYCRADETVLVLCDSGDSREYSPGELQPLQ